MTTSGVSWFGEVWAHTIVQIGVPLLLGDTPCDLLYPFVPLLLGEIRGGLVIAHVADTSGVQCATQTQWPLIHSRTTTAGSWLHRHGGPAAQSPHRRIVYVAIVGSVM